jgi:hypothetical protein
MYAQRCDDRYIESENLENNIRADSDNRLDNFTVADVQVSLEYLEGNDHYRLKKAYENSDALEIGQLMLKCGYSYADTLASIKNGV